MNHLTTIQIKNAVWATGRVYQVTCTQCGKVGDPLTSRRAAADLAAAHNEIDRAELDHEAWRPGPLRAARKGY
jgi:hypothetical protein